MNGLMGDAHQVERCEFCDGYAHRSIQSTKFIYGDGEGAVELTADMPVWVCQACDIVYSAEGAEEAERTAICRHLGRLTPQEIFQVRQRLGLTQEAFGQRLDASRLSVTRWEGGQQMQSAVFDRRIREFLAHADRPKKRDTSAPRKCRFKTPVDHRRPAAAAFELIAA